MDTYEATNVLLSKIKNIDPANASKIMGYILIQDFTDNDLLSLALGSETLLQNVIIKAKTHLGLFTNALSTYSERSSPSLFNPVSKPKNNHDTSLQSSAKANPFLGFAKNPFPHSWPASGLTNNSTAASIGPKSSPFLSYDNIRAGSAVVPQFSNNCVNGSGGDASSNSSDLLNEYQIDEYFPFLDELSPKNDESVDPRIQLGGFNVNNVESHLHRRRFSESDACIGIEDVSFGIGNRPCMYFARGFCKNGDNCKFIHGGFDGDNISEVSGSGVIGGSVREIDGLYLQQHEDLMRIKSAQQQQRLAYNKYMNFLLQQESEPQRMRAASAMMGDEFHKFGLFHSERNDLLVMAMEEKANSASRQIYLTFPADSAFKDEDVSNYFSTFGPVQDVRIPYQQKRMFGFVTFVHPETVKLILSRGNPHFICDSRVLVKPYKEKGKIANKRQQHLQQHLMDKGDFSPFSSPSGLDPRELYDLHIGARMLYNSQGMMLRRKLEQQAELQQTIELQGRRLINLHLPDLRGDYVHHHRRSLSAGTPISVPPHTSVDINQNLTSEVENQDILEDRLINGSCLISAWYLEPVLDREALLLLNSHSVVAGKCDSSAATIASTFAVAEQNLQQQVNTTCIQSKDTVNGEEEKIYPEGCDANECCGTVIEHGIPDSPFAPTKSLGNQGRFSPPLAELKESTKFSGTLSSEISASMPMNSTSDVASH
ncbi:zinc finger CCCH domain-containing protein 55 isoform X2 [Hevea brasiliensis]|uniref:zinc finger CCCH domain-containing protein 55 isoform X2 n=1 Tax=Hevea brasiliensis TaxID=3981 RepID=UPI0025FDDF18|nr:zinc finger CCCH domain-containing protein 55 isoform X2 [Hevea brasiliensis]